MLKEEQKNEQENAEQRGESSSNFLGEIPESWKRRARAAFGYAFCVTMLIVVPSEIAAGIFPGVTWIATVTSVVRHIGIQMYHFGIGWGMGIVAPCLVWEHIMYLREKRAREREQRAREQAEAVVAELRERVSTLEQPRREREQVESINAQLHERIRALEEEQRVWEQAQAVIAELQKEVAELRRELDATNTHSQ